MTYYLLVEKQPYAQEAWQAEQIPDGRPLKPNRPARDEHLITMRLNRQFTATVRVNSASLAASRHASIIDACSKVGIGEEIAPGIQIVEYEAMLDKAQMGTYTPASKEKDGKSIPEQYQAPQKERLYHRFTIRRNGADLLKVTLEDSELKKADWKATLRARIPEAETFSS